MDGQCGWVIGLGGGFRPLSGTRAFGSMFSQTYNVQGFPKCPGLVCFRTVVWAEWGCERRDQQKLCRPQRQSHRGVSPSLTCLTARYLGNLGRKPRLFDLPRWPSFLYVILISVSFQSKRQEREWKRDGSMEECVKCNATTPQRARL